MWTGGFRVFEFLTMVDGVSASSSCEILHQFPNSGLKFLKGAWCCHEKRPWVLHITPWRFPCTKNGMSTSVRWSVFTFVIQYFTSSWLNPVWFPSSGVNLLKVAGLCLCINNRRIAICELGWQRRIHITLWWFPCMNYNWTDRGVEFPNNVKWPVFTFFIQYLTCTWMKSCVIFKAVA